MHVRRAKFEDVPLIIDLGTRLVRRGAFQHTTVNWRRATNRLLRAIQSEWISVAEHNGRIVGFLILCEVPYWWTQGEFYVLDDGIYAEHPGAGRALIREGVRWARALGAKEVIIALNSNLQTERSIKVFERMGFTLRGACVSIDTTALDGAKQWAA